MSGGRRTVGLERGVRLWEGEKREEKRNQRETKKK